jgi:hypothetical protein
LNLMTALLMFVCEDAYGCRHIALPLPNITHIQCMYQAPAIAADWSASLDGMARVHNYKCITIPIEQDTHLPG